MCGCFRPLPLPPKGGETPSLNTMPVPAPRSIRHSYEPVRSSSAGNLLISDSQEEDDSDDRYMLVEPSVNPTARSVSGNSLLVEPLTSR